MSDVSDVSVATELLALHLSSLSIGGSSSSSALLASASIGAFGATVALLVVLATDSRPLLLEAGVGSGVLSGSRRAGSRPHFDAPNLDGVNTNDFP